MAWRTGDLNGEGDAQLTAGRLEGVRILEEVGRVLKINELVAPIITKAQTHFVVQNRQTKFIGLQLESTLFKLTGDGVVTFDGALNANLVLILNRDAMTHLPQAAAASFVQQQDGSGSIAFQVSGHHVKSADRSPHPPADAEQGNQERNQQGAEQVVSLGGWCSVTER